MPDYHSYEEFQGRSLKLGEIRQMGLDPYPASFQPTATLKELVEKFHEAAIGDSEKAALGETEKFVVAGRLILFRAMGKNIFAQIQQEGTRLQVMFNRDNTHVTGVSETPLKFLEKKVDLGDFLGIEGHIFRTHKGELTLYAKECTLLCKSLLPLPEKHSGLSDKELRYRKRWLDLIDHKDVLETFQKRSHILREIRAFFASYDFMEVETPILTSSYGGAQAKPFLTHLNALHEDFFLRISLEIGLKKLIVGGFNRLYEIGKVFRNEGLDKTHNPEFTMVEAYAAYWDYNDMMRFVENLFEKVALSLYGKTEVPALHPHTGEAIWINFKAPWKRLTMKKAILDYAGIDVDSLSDDELRSKLSELDPKEVKSATRGLLIAKVFEEYAEKHLIEPHHIIDHPIETTPLCKLHREPKERSEGLVERFESFVLCHEICNAYTELNDPELQRKLLEEQNAKKEAGDEEANPLDEEFIEAICQGMPPTGGIGIGIDRMVMLLTNTQSIRDIIFFPLMKGQE